MKSRSRQLRRAAATWTIIAGAIAGLSCSDSATQIAAVGKPAAMLIVSGDVQQATVGTELPAAVVVRVVDSAGKRVKDQIVNFKVVSGGGSVFAGVGSTNKDGEARERWTLGTVAADSQRLEARAVDATTGAALVFATFRATAVAAAASKLKRASLDSVEVTVATPVPTPPSVKVVDQYENPVAGTVVTFAVASGGGSLTSGSQTTNASGIATVGSWTLGTTAGVNTLSATATGLAGSPLTIPATGVAGAPTQIAINAGNSQSAAAGTAVSAPPSVVVKDVNNNGVSGVSVTFVVASGGGSLTGGTQTTNSSGIATVGSWRVGTTAGANTVTATATALTGSPLTFTATGVAGSAKTIAASAGNNQTAPAGGAVSTLPSVIVKDTNNNVVSGVSVTFAVASGGGSLTGGTQTTNGSGIATVGSWTLGATPGTNTLTATSTGLAGSPVTFSATASSSGPVARVNVAPISFGILVGDTVTLTATAYDAADFVVSGLPVTWIQPSSAASVSTSGLLTGLAGGGGALKATIGGVTGPPGGGGVSVYTSLDSVGFVFTNAGVPQGWTQTTQPVGQSNCVQLYTWGPPGLTNALRWQPTVSDSTIMAISRQTNLPQSHCFRALKAGTVTVFGSFGGKTGQKSITIP